VDRSRVVSILAPYSPPLAPSQVEAIATKIVAEVEKLEADYEAKLKEVTEETEPKETEAEAPTAPEPAPTKKTSKSKS
jgi:ABC-type Zn uptake system ZnuABC Zn-binding protein ZnuA